MQNLKNCNKVREESMEMGQGDIPGDTLGGELELQSPDWPQQVSGGAGTRGTNYRNMTSHSKQPLILGAYYVPSIL